ncbi:MAG: thiamine pyrophosphate-binding protein [Nitrososphaeria archaeon]
MRGSDFIAECLADEGVETAFTVSAENISPLLKSLLVKGIKLVNSKLELSAAFMAVIYSRVKRLPGLLVVTAGPGVIGSLSPIAAAMVEGDPLVVIGGFPSDDGKTSHMHQLVKRGDQMELMKPVTKTQYRIECYDQISSCISKAFVDSASDKPGPVYVELSVDLLVEDGVRVEYVKGRIRKPKLDSGSVKLVADLLEKAGLPVIIAGRGVYLAEGENELISVAELLGAPITTTIMAKGLIPNEHPLYAGVAAGRTGDATAQTVISRADVVLAVGNRFSEMGTGRYSLKINGSLVHVNIDGNEIGRTFKPEIAIISDAKEFLSSLLKELSSRKYSYKINNESMLSIIREKESQEIERFYSEAKTDLIESFEVVKAVREMAEKDAIFICDVGAHRVETFIMPVYISGTYVTTTSYISMGLAVPGAVAASIEYPNKQVFGIVGDGGFLMTGLEIATAVEYGAKPIIVVFNDSSYKVLRIYEHVKYHSDTRELYKIPKVDFSKIADALGAKGISVEKREDLYPSIKNALDWNKGPVVLDVKINPQGIPIPFQRLYGHRYIKDLN